MSQDTGLELAVDAARKRDAGRGIARLSETARQQLGVLSGDTVVIEGEYSTVATVWPASDDTAGAILIDADTRANAGVSIGDHVHVRKRSIADADAVSLAAPSSIRIDDPELVESTVKRELLDRPVGDDERVRIERLGDDTFVVTDTEPEGTVRVTDETDVSVSVSTPDVAADGTAPAARTEQEPESETSGDTGSTAEPELPSESRPAPGDGSVTYEDIGGLDEELDLVREMIELPLSEPEIFTRLGIEPPKGVLLHGPPGTGKTLIAKAVANEVNATFVSISGPEIMSKYKGESEEQLREKFAQARENAPAIVFFDEIDSIASKREDGGEVEDRIVGQLLSLMDGLDARGDVVVIGATNRVDALDPALRRGGRFDREIEIGAPDETGRHEILSVHTRHMPLGDSVDLDRLAGRTHGFVGADLAALTKEAAMNALRRSRQDAATLTDATVTRDDFESALSSVEPSAMREYVAETPDQGFDAVGGLDDAKETLKRAVTWPLTYGPLFEAADADPPAGVLLYGPPGSGKTMLARAIAAESEVNFIHVKGPELLDRYVGESEKAVREVFERARQASPAIVFFDEIDAVATTRSEGDYAGAGDAGVTERVVSQLLTELDGAAANPNLMVLAATNRRGVIDPALLRPGRLEMHVEVPEPEVDARRKILEVHTADKPLADEVNLDAIAAETAGYSGADLAAVCREAAMLAVTDVAESYDGEEANEHPDEVVIRADHFTSALAAVKPALE